MSVWWCSSTAIRYLALVAEKEKNVDGDVAEMGISCPQDNQHVARYGLTHIHDGGVGTVPHEIHHHLLGWVVVEKTNIQMFLFWWTKMNFNLKGHDALIRNGP